jgi:hypothetical protein
MDVGEDPFNRHSNFGPASFDRRHIFVTTYDYHLPFFNKMNGVGGAILSGWEVSGITRYQAGAPFTVTANTAIGGRRADYVGGEFFCQMQVLMVGLIRPRCPAPATRRGNSGAGIVVGPNLQTWDFSMRKQFNITERFNLRFQADMFNLSNHTNFRGPATVLTNAGFGTIGTTGPPRNIQFGLKVNF